jgi:hypothetical protein
MEKLIVGLMFIGYVSALLVCLFAIVAGIWLTYKTRCRSKDELVLENPDAKWKVQLKATGGIVLAIAGLAGSCFVVYHYWQALLGVLLLASAGAGETVRRRSKHEPVDKSAYGKSVNKRIARSKTTKKQSAKGKQ